MTTFIRRVFVACLLLGVPSSFAAGQNQDAGGSKDHPLISRYPGSVIGAYFQKEFDEFTLPLGKLADEKFTKSQHLEGKVTRIVYAAPEGRSVLEVFRNYQGALNKAGFETLFTCGPQDCYGSGSRVQGCTVAVITTITGDPITGFITFRRSSRGRRATFM